MSSVDPPRWLRFIQTESFARDWDDQGLGDGDLNALETAIMFGPDRWPVVKGTGALRKVRFALPGQGKRGGLRVCYVYFAAHGIVWLVALFAKNEKADLSHGERNAIAGRIREIERLLGEGGV